MTIFPGQTRDSTKRPPVGLFLSPLVAVAERKRGLEPGTIQAMSDEANAAGGPPRHFKLDDPKDFAEIKAFSDKRKKRRGSTTLTSPNLGGG